MERERPQDFSASRPEPGEGAEEIRPEAAEALAEKFGKEEKEALFGRKLSEHGKRLARLMIFATALAGGAEYLRHRVEQAQPVAQFDQQEVSRSELEDLAEIDPSSILIHASQFQDQPWAGKVIEKAARTLLRLGNGDKVLRFARAFGGASYAKELVAKAAEQNPLEAVRYAANYRALPESEAILRKAIENCWRERLAVLKYAENFRHLPEAESIVAMQVQSAYPESGLALEFAKGYRNYPQAEEILRQALAKAVVSHPELVLRYSKSYANQAWTKEFILKAAEKAPRAAIQWFSDYRQAFPQEADKILERAIAKVSPWDSQVLVKYFENYKHLSQSEKILKQTVEQLMKAGFDRSIVLEYAQKFLDRPWASEVIRKVAESHSYAAVQYYKNYQNLEGAESLLREAAEKVVSQERNVDWLFKYFSYFSGKAWGKDLMMRAVRSQPVLAVLAFRNYQDLPEAQDLLKNALSILPESQSETVLACAGDYGYYDKPWARSLIISAASKAPGAVLKYFSPRWPEAEKLLEQSLKLAPSQDPRAVLANAYSYSFGRKKLVREAIAEAAKQDFGAALEFADEFRSLDGAPEIILRAASQAATAAPEQALKYQASFVNYPGGEEIFRQAAAEVLRKNPAALLENFSVLKNEPWAEAMLLAAVLKHPSFALHERKQILSFLQDSKDGRVKILLKLAESDDYLTAKEKKELWDDVKQTIKTSMAILLINRPELSLQQAANLAKNKNKLLDTFLALRADPKASGLFSLDSMIANQALQKVYELNRLHDRPEAVRFRSVSEAGALELYALTVYGEQEVFTSTFNGLFSRLLGKLKQEKMTSDELLAKAGDNRFRIFIKLCSQYNRLNEFLAAAAPEAKEKILERFVSGIEQEQDMPAQAVAVADTFATLEDASILKVLQNRIKVEYDRVARTGNKSAETIYGLLAGMFGKKAVVNEAWLREMGEKYKLPDLFEIPSAKLFNPDGTNIQQHFFYDDPDGQASFRSFLAQYRGSADWKIEQQKNYVRIISTRGKKIEIFANLPDKSQGNEDIEKILKGRKIETIVVAHRGHSYHADRTIRAIPSIAKIVYLGSCGGYNNINEVLKRAPEANILATKGVGTMLVNDPLLKMLNEEIRDEDRSLHWLNFWQRAEKRLGGHSDFRNYIPPYKNLGVLFLKAYSSKLKGS